MLDLLQNYRVLGRVEMLRYAVRTMPERGPDPCARNPQDTFRELLKRRVLLICQSGFLSYR